MTINAVIRQLNNRRVITLLIEFGRKFQNFLGAVFNTVTASFAAIFDDMNYAARDLNLFYIQWNSPECHDPFLKMNKKLKLLL